MANSEQLAEAGLCLNHCMCCLRPFPLTSQWILSVVTGLLILSWASDGVCSPSKDTPRQQFVWSMKHLSSRPEKDTKRFFFLFFFFFPLSETFQGHVCVHWVYKAHFHSISLWLRSFNRIIIVPSFIKCDRLVSASFLEPCCPEISAYRPLEHKTDWADVSDTLRDASPADSVCRIWCERLNWDSLLLLLLLLLLESPKK